MTRNLLKKLDKTSRYALWRETVGNGNVYKTYDRMTWMRSKYCSKASWSVKQKWTQMHETTTDATVLNVRSDKRIPTTKVTGYIVINTFNDKH